MVKFIEKNKKIFSCYEKSILYLKCAHCMMMYDMYLSYEYLEKSLKYRYGLLNMLAREKNEEKQNLINDELESLFIRHSW